MRPLPSIHNTLSRQLLRSVAVVGTLASLSNFGAEAQAQYDPHASKYPKALGEKSLAMVAVNFDGQRQLPFSTDQMRQQTFEAPGSVADYYSKASFGQFALRGEVFGPVSVPARVIDAECGEDSHVKLGQAANKAVAQQTGRNINGFTNYGYTLPRAEATAGCDFGGWSLGNSFINLETRAKFGLIPERYHTGNVVHELAHNFGLSHANAIRCRDAKGRAISYSTWSYMSGRCREIRYGDPIDPMGQGQLTTETPPDMSAINKARLGWLKAENITTIKRSGEVTIAPLEMPTDQPQLVRIPNGLTVNTTSPHYFYVDFRQPIGLDSAIPANSPLVNGVSIREAGPINESTIMPLSNFTNFIDTTPKTPQAADGTLTVGRTFKDASTGIKIQTLSVGAEGAKIRITGLNHNHSGSK